MTDLERAIASVIRDKEHATTGLNVAKKQGANIDADNYQYELNGLDCEIRTAITCLKSAL